MPSRLTDEVWLRERVAAYASNVEIAAEAGVTTRAVRYALRRYGIKHPLRQDLADVAVAEYQAGTPLDQIAAKVHRSRTWIYQAADAAGAQRPPHHRRVSRQYPQLNDAAWMAARFDAGGSVKSIAHELGADRHAVRKAMVRHGLDRWPGQLAERFRQALDLEADARPRPCGSCCAGG